MKISNETKVGLLAVISLAVLFIGYSYLKGNDVFSSDKTYYAVYKHVDGLTVSKPVLVNGFQIGRVSGMQLQPDGSIRAALKIDAHIIVPKNTIARIESTDLLGSKAIVFEIGNSPEQAENKSYLLAGVQANLMDKVTPIQRKVEQITSKLDSTLSAVNSILDEDFQRTFKTSVHHMSNSMENISQITKEVQGLLGTERQRLHAIMGNLESITTNFKHNGTQLTSIMQHIDQVTDQAAKVNFKETVDKANQAMADFQTIATRINNGEGSIGLLLNDEKLYTNLSNASESLDNLLKDVKDKPSKYVHFSIFGKKNPK